jgi:hypothetical protein
MVYTAISVLGTFSFAVLEPYQAVQFEIETTQDTLNHAHKRNALFSIVLYR